MKFTADLHMHADGPTSEGRGWHGERPEKLAEEIVKAKLDVVAVTEHNRVSQKYFELQEAIAELTEGQRREVTTLLGAELAMSFEGHMYHIGYVFEEEFTPQNLPAIPELGDDISKLEELRESHPGVATVFHPTWKDGERGRSPRITAALMASGYVEGVELLNGACFDFINRHWNNGGRRQRARSSFEKAKDGVEMFSKARSSLREGGKQLAAIGNSDAHRARIVGTMFTEFTGQSPEDVFEAIRRGHTSSICNVNGVVRKRVQSMMGSNGAGSFIKIRNGN